MNNETFPRDILLDLAKWLDRREVYAIRGLSQPRKNTNHKNPPRNTERKNVVFSNFEDAVILKAFVTNPTENIKSFIRARARSVDFKSPQTLRGVAR